MFTKRLRSIVLAITLLIGLTGNAFSAVSVLEQVGKKGFKYLDDILRLGGVEVAERELIEKTLGLNFKALNKGVVPRTIADYQKIIASTPGLKKLRHIFEMDSDVFEKQLLKELDNLDSANPKSMIGDLVNAASDDAAIYGKGAFSACGGCVSSAASKLGITRMVKAVVQGSLVQKFIKTGQDIGVGKLLGHIKRFLAKLKMSYRDRVNFLEKLNKRHYVTYYAALRAMKEGTPEQLEFGTALSKFCVGKQAGKRVTSYASCFRLMSIVIDETDQGELKNWAKRLGQVSQEAPLGDDLSRLPNLRKSFLQQAEAAAEGGDDSLMVLFKEMDSKKPCPCFWGKCAI